MFFDDNGKYSHAQFKECKIFISLLLFVINKKKKDGLELGRVPMINKDKSENNYNLFYYMLYGESASVLGKFFFSPI